MRYKALKYGEYFAGTIISYKQKRGLFVIFKECIDLENYEWSVKLETDSGIMPGSILEFEDGVLCEIVKKRSSVYYLRFLKKESDKSSIWIAKNIMASSN
ncbi:MAG: hypothetical protein HGA77_00855 [Chlorobiaceae bacterium]|nr:hypothetical protein [Chlorobiaceae bacterium]